MAKTRHVIEAQDKVTPELNKISRALDKTQRDFDNAGKVMERAGKALVGMFALDKVKDLAVQSYTAFAKHDVTLRRFGATVAQTGGDIEGITKRFSDLEGQLEKTSGVDGDQVLDLASKYIALGRSADEVEKLILIATDLSAVTGQDLAASMEVLTKADLGQVKALKSLIPELAGLTDEAIKSGGAVDVIGQKLDGMAEKIYGGAQGSINKLSASFGELSEHAGSFIDSISKPFADQLQKQLDSVNSMLAGMENIDTLLARANAVVTGRNEQELLTNELSKYKAKLKIFQDVQEGFKQIAGGASTVVIDGKAITSVEALKELQAAQSLLGFRAGEKLNSPQGRAAMENQVKLLTGLIAEREKKLKEFQAQRDELVGGSGETDASFLKDINAANMAADAYLKKLEASQDLQAEEDSRIAKEQEIADIFERQNRLIAESEELIERANQAYLKKKEIHGSKARDGNNKVTNPEKAWQTFQDGFAYFNTGIDALEGFYGTWMNLQAEQEEAAIEAMKRQVQAVEEQYEAHLKTRREAGQDTAEYETNTAKEIEAAKQAIADKEREQKRKSWEANKQAQLYSAIMGTANATISALGTFPFSPANLAMAALVGGLGAAQVGLISSQPTPEFAVGTPRVPRDMGAIVHQGEMIIPQTFAEGLRRGDLTLGWGGGPTVQINLSGAVYGSLEGMTKEINRELRRLRREGKL